MPGATGVLAAIPGYRVAGKTGTAWKAENGSYSQEPLRRRLRRRGAGSNPRLAAVVVIDEPTAGKYYGGDVSAPVFSAVVGGALRLLGVPPDDADASGHGPRGCRRAAWRSDEPLRMQRRETAWRPLKAVLGGGVDVPETVEVSDLTLDSRSVRAGAAFLACHGRTHHGLEFAQRCGRRRRDARCCGNRRPASSAPAVRSAGAGASRCRICPPRPGTSPIDSSAHPRRA